LAKQHIKIIFSNGKDEKQSWQLKRHQHTFSSVTKDVADFSKFFSASARSDWDKLAATDIKT
jgi:hypothetical protein